MKKYIFAFLASLIVISSYSQTTLNVLAAANVRDAMNEMKQIYISKNPNITINISYGASGMLIQQIINGANCDIFFSADENYANKLKELGLIVGEVTPYAGGMLLLHSNTIDISTIGLDVLKLKEVKKIAVANPKAAPYGERAVETIKKLGVFEDVKSKIVYGENISAAAQYTLSGNVDVGFIALSQSKSPKAKITGYSYMVPTELYTPIIQSCVKIKRKDIKEETAKFLEFVLSDSCKAIWLKYGYNTKF